MRIMVLSVFIILLLPGCITSSYHRSNEEYGHALNEFDTKSDTNFKIFKGVWAGTTEIKGAAYCHLQFEGPLKGKGRYLDVLFPLKGKMVQGYDLVPGKGLVESKKLVERPGDVFFKESDKKVPDDRPAYLIIQVTQPFYQNTSQDYIYTFTGQKIGKESDPVAIVKKHFNFDIMEPHYPLAVAVLNVSNRFKYTANALVWDKGPGATPVVSCIGIDTGEYDGPHLDVGWKERNRPVYIFRQAGYIGTVIADAVTSPVQLIMLLLTAMGGGVR